MNGQNVARLPEADVDIRIVQLMLEHSDVNTTQRYLNMTDEECGKHSPASGNGDGS